MSNPKKDPITNWRVRSFFLLIFGIMAWNTVCFASKGIYHPKHRWEFGAAVSAAFLDATFHHEYSPQVYNYTVTELDSLVKQHVNIKGKNALGVELMLNAFIGKKIGIQFLGNFHNTQLQGTDNLEHIHLRFSYKPYPDFHPRIVYKDEWFSMKDTEGYLIQKTFSLNMIVRFPLARWIDLDISGGASLFLFSGEAEPIGYIYHGFAHFIFVSIPYSFAFSIPATAAPGANVGEELNVAVGRHLILFASCRYYHSFGGSSKIKLTSNLNQPDSQDQENLRIFEQRLNLGPLKIKTSFFSMKIGLGFGF
jgi:hypothetical protein